MSPSVDKMRSISEHARDFRASKGRVEEGVETSEGRLKKVERIRKAKALVAANRDSQAAADAVALIKQRESLEGITGDEIAMSVGALKEEENIGASAQEVETGQALEEAFKKFKN